MDRLEEKKLRAEVLKKEIKQREMEEITEEKIEYEDLLCPKCDSDEFDYIDESNFLDNPSVVYFECKSCGCSFSALRHIQYSKVSEVSK